MSLLKNLTLLDEHALCHVARQLAEIIETQGEGAIIYLSGQLGAGKTTFARSFIQSLGYQEKVKSPTYTLLEPYPVSIGTIWHIDLYRLHSPQEILQLGMDACFAEHAITLIEWPEQGGEYLPVPDLTCAIEFAPLGRTMRITAQTAKGERILGAITD